MNQYYFLFTKRTLVIAIVFTFAIIYTGAFSASASIPVNVTVTDYNRTYFAVNATKTTGGLPFLENDVYNTLGVEVWGTWWEPTSNNNGSWVVNLAVVDLASSKAAGGKSYTYTLKSQTISINDVDHGGVELFASGPQEALQEWSWPHDGLEPSPVWQGPPMQAIAGTINYTGENGGYPLNASELYHSVRIKTDNKKSWRQYGYWKWYYSAMPWGDKANSAAIARCKYVTSPGQTVEFDVIAITDWGIIDTSESRMHIKVTTPPNIWKDDRYYDMQDKYEVHKTLSNFTVEIT